jgi:exosome complex RNA-binding protein Rrp4
MSAPGELVLPGDVIRTNKSPNVTLGPGLFQRQDSAIVATRAGELRQTGKNKYWVQSGGRRARVGFHLHALSIYLRD